MPGELASQGDLLKLYVGGVLYPNVAALNFANAQSYFDTASSTLQIGAPLYQDAVRIGTSTTYGDLTRAAGGALLWDGSAMASEALVATKQDALEHYSETSGVTTDLVNTLDNAPFIGSGVVQNSGYQTLSFPNGIYMNRAQGHVVGTRLYLTVEARTSASSQLDELPFAIANADGTWGDTIVFRLTSEFVKYTWSTVISNQHVLIFLHKAQTGEPTSVYAPLAGSVDIRNVHLYKTDALAAISTPLICARDLDCQQTVLCQHLIADHGISAERVHIGEGSLSRGAAGELLWDGAAMASESLVSQVQNDLQINLNATVSYVQANFQGKLASVNESTTDAVILQSLDDSDLHIAWTVAPNASYTNQTGFQTITQSSTTSGHILARPGGQVPVPGAALRFSVELKAGTKTEIVIHNDDVTNISSRASFQQSLTNTWQTVVWEYGPTSTDRFSLYFGLTDDQYTQSPGTYYLRNLRVTQPDIVVNFSQDVAITGQCTAQAFVTSSDERIKGDVQLVDPAKCLQIVKSIPPKIYTRTDLGESQEDPERRIGVIAQDVARAVPAEWKNVVYYQDKSLAVDYSRLSALLLGAVQSLSTRLEALEAQ